MLFRLVLGGSNSGICPYTTEILEKGFIKIFILVLWHNIKYSGKLWIYVFTCIFNIGLNVKKKLASEGY
jgi:hypothetical protein